MFMFGGRAWSPDAAADAGNGMFRCDIPRGSYTSDMLGACLLYHNDCDWLWAGINSLAYAVVGISSEAGAVGLLGPWAATIGNVATNFAPGRGACL